MNTCISPSTDSYKHFTFTATPPRVERARVGSIVTPHGTIATPNFVFCATKASIKGLSAHQVDEIGADIILANTYHLMIQPQAEIIDQCGGLHAFMNWHKPMLTDSGGYQVFAMGHGSVSSEIKKHNRRSLPKSLLHITENGVWFKSYVDGKKLLLTPERSMDVQRLLGADLVVQFDECTPYHVDKAYTAESMRRSLRWGQRSLHEFHTHNNHTQAVYGIVQGGIYPELRKESAESMREQGFFASAIGGSLGVDSHQMHDVVAITTRMLDLQHPIHLLGIGDIPNIFWGVREGIDTFDCVHPTRIARHGTAIVPYTVSHTLRLNLKNRTHCTDNEPIDPVCTLPCCKHYSRAYVHHLFKAKELLGMTMLTMHNIGQMVRLMRDIRGALSSDSPSMALDTVEKFWTGTTTV